MGGLVDHLGSLAAGFSLVGELGSSVITVSGWFITLLLFVKPWSFPSCYFIFSIWSGPRLNTCPIHANLNIPFDQIVWVLSFDLSSIRIEKGPINNVDRGEKGIGSSYIHYLFVFILFYFWSSNFHYFNQNKLSFPTMSVKKMKEECEKTTREYARL